MLFNTIIERLNMDFNSKNLNKFKLWFDREIGRLGGNDIYSRNKNVSFNSLLKAALRRVLFKFNFPVDDGFVVTYRKQLIGSGPG